MRRVDALLHAVNARRNLCLCLHAISNHVCHSAKSAPKTEPSAETGTARGEKELAAHGAIRAGSRSDGRRAAPLPSPCVPREAFLVFNLPIRGRCFEGKQVKR